MKTSVALATYNGANYIEEQLQSILDQTTKVDEVVIHDDCSKDNTAEIVQEFIVRNGLSASWHFEVNTQNLGFAENFRQTTYCCTGDIIFFCDQDDIWVPDRVEKMKKVLEENEAIQVLYTKHCQFTDNIITKEKRDTFHIKKTPVTSYYSYLRSYGCAMCARKSFIDEIHDDWYMGWAHDEAVWTLAVILDGLYYFDFCSIYHRCHSNNVSGNLGHNKSKRIKYLDSVLTSSEHIVKVVERRGAKRKTRHIYERNIEMAWRRMGLVKERKIWNSICLIPYLKNYYSKKSYFVEILMALKGN